MKAPLSGKTILPFLRLILSVPVPSLANKRALITGASSGIGSAIARRFVDAGATVVLASRRRPDLLDELAAENKSAAGRGVWVETDISSSEQVTKLFARADRIFAAPLDILVNNAGVQLAKTVDETSDQEWDALNAVNLNGAFFCSRAAVQRMRAAGQGSIINVGSIAGETADPGLAVYSASKGWLHALTRAVAADHGKHGIRCNAVCPTWTMTEMSAEFFQAAPDPRAARRRVEQRHPLRRLAQPDDVARVVLWLASDAAAYVSGQCLAVDGGLSATSGIDPQLDLGGA